MVITNPVIKKSILYEFPFSFQPPPLTTGISICPNFDIPSMKKNQSDDSYSLTITNNYTDIIIPYPTVRLTCTATTKTTKSPYSLMGIYIYDSFNLTKGNPLTLINL